VLPQRTAAARSEIDAQLLRLIEQDHGGTLTDAERDELRASLAAQSAAIDVLRGFGLGNDDAPCFAPHLARDGDDAG
jgi:hypothetical protein